MMAIEKLALGGSPKEGRELLDIALAEEETAANRAEGRKAHSLSDMVQYDFGRSGCLKISLTL
jgi:hypothetical protein